MNETNSTTHLGKTINMLFMTFQAIYPNWQKGQSLSQINLAKKLWARHLRHFDISIIEQGVDRVVDLFPSFPPTLGEFKQSLIVRPEHRPVKLELIEPSKNPEVAKSAMQQLKELVGKKKL